MGQRGINLFMHFYTFQSILCRLRHTIFFFFLIFVSAKCTRAKRAKCKALGSEATEYPCSASLKRHEGPRKVSLE